jgi:hypothetical protein
VTTGPSLLLSPTTPQVCAASVLTSWASEMLSGTSPLVLLMRQKHVVSMQDA